MGITTALVTALWLRSIELSLRRSFPDLKGAKVVLLDSNAKPLDVAKVNLWKDGAVGHWDESVALYILVYILGLQ